MNDAVILTAKEWLTRGRKLEHRIKALKERTLVAYERATNGTQSYNMGCSNKKGFVSNDKKSEVYTSLKTEVEKQIAILEQTRCEILEVINRVNDNVLCALLTDYYINNYNLDEIAEFMGYSQRHTVRLHRKAIDCVREITGLA